MELGVLKEINSRSDVSISEFENTMYSKGEVQRAGETLIIPDISSSDPERYAQAMKVLSYWRSCHIAPLDVLYSKLEKDAVKIDRKAIVAKRLKRTPSIITKLTRFNAMKLRNMQDIGGCRIIVTTLKHVLRLRRQLNAKRQFKETDYIARPKDDGYRGVHLVGKFPGKGGTEYALEVQLRTALQHSWATAVEIIDLFTNQSLKSDQGKDDWKKFFSSASVEMAALETGLPPSDEFAGKELSRLAKKLDVFKRFGFFSASLQVLNEAVKSDDGGYFLIQIDTSKSTLGYEFYGINSYEEATKQYLQAEKKNIKNNYKVVALVSSSSISDLKEAYPNYFADSKIFLINLKHVLDRYEVRNPGWLKQFFIDLPRLGRGY